MIKMNDERVLHEFETYLEHCFDHLPASRTKEAMKYSLLAPTGASDVAFWGIE